MRFVIFKSADHQRLWNSRDKTWVTEQDGSYTTYQSQKIAERYARKLAVVYEVVVAYEPSDLRFILGEKS